ncbi:hypothetical protein BGZ98_004526, partial [Dissophora globulifera]
PMLALPPIEFPLGEDVVPAANASRNVTMTPRIGSTGSQLVSPVNDVRKRTGRRVLHRPRPLDLDHTKLHWRSSLQQPQQSSATTSGSGSDHRPASAFPALISGANTGAGVGYSVTQFGPATAGASTTPKEPKHKAKFPLLQIKTDFNPSTTFRRTSMAPLSSNNIINQNTATQPTTNINISNNANETQRKEPSKWQVGLERILKKIQRRKRAPSNLLWYAARSTESYISGTGTMPNFGSEALKREVDSEAEELQFGPVQPPQWITKSLQAGEMFFSDDTVELMLNLRDYLIKSTDSGWDVAELKEEIFPVDHKSLFYSRRNRSVSPHGSPRRTSPIGNTSGAASPGAASQDSAASSRRNSRSSADFEHLSQHVAGRYADEETGSYRLLDYFMSILSDVISHDSRYRVQHPRPSRPEWALHSIVLDVLVYLSKVLAHDHKAIYDIGMVALSAFPVFKNNALIRLLDLMTDMILPSFALSRAQPFGATQVSPPPVSPNMASPLSPSKIRVQLDNNQTFAIQVHSPTEEQGMLAVPKGGGQLFNPLNSAHIPSPRSSSTSFSKAIPGATTQAQDTMDTHANSLISLTLLAVLQQVSFSKSPLPIAKQLERSIGDLLRIKPDLSVDLLQVVAVIENETVMHRALEVLWWIERPSLGHHTLSEKLLSPEYESILLMRQATREWDAAPASMTIGARAGTVRSDLLLAFRKGSLDDTTILPRTESETRSNVVGSFGIKSKLLQRPSLPWRASQGNVPLSGAQQQHRHHHQHESAAASGTDYLEDHQLYPYMSQLLHASEVNVFEDSTNQTYKTQAGHHLLLVNMFSTCLCAACKLPLWGYHHQAYRCRDCGQLVHSNCTGTGLQNCSTITQSPTLRHSTPTQISYQDLRKSFLEFYRGLISTWDSLQLGSALLPGTPSLPSPAATTSSAHSKDQYPYEEASCNASVLALQVGLLRNGIARGEIMVLDWLLDGQATDEGLLASSGFELFKLEKYFMDLVRHLRTSGSLASSSPFLCDFFEDSEPDEFLLFSAPYWSHFAALAKTMMKDAKPTSRQNSQYSYNHHLSSPIDFDPTSGTAREDIFALRSDTTQDQLLAGFSVHTRHTPLATIFRFCMRRLGFQSTWSMQLVLQEWVKIGLLERLDGEFGLFEDSSLDSLSPSTALPTSQSTLSPNARGNTWASGGIGSKLPTFQTSYFDTVGNSSSGNNDTANAIPEYQPAIRNVHCLFPIVTAIDPTSDVENLIQAIWRCLSSVDLSVNECGFLLLSRQCWPDPFMSDYTAERLAGCIFHWYLLEDDHLFSIHKNCTSKGKRIPGVRIDLEEQLAIKHTALGGSGVANRQAGVNRPELSEASILTPSVTAAANATTHSTNRNATGSITAAVAYGNHSSGVTSSGGYNSKSSSANSSMYGAVGSYVMTRKLMAKKYALPWLRRIMDLSPESYVDMVYRQIRVLEREMASGDEEESPAEDGLQNFHHARVERYLESIIKLRQAGFLFNSFSKVLCRWLEEVEDLLEGTDISSTSFKILSRLFMKASSSSSRSGTGVGLGIMQLNAQSTLNEQSTPVPVNRALMETESAGGGQDREWRARLRAKLQQGSSTVGGPVSTSFSSLSNLDGTVSYAVDDTVETPLHTLQAMLAPTDAADRSDSLERALFWLDLMVQSDVQVPFQAFKECCNALVDSKETPLSAASTDRSPKQLQTPSSVISADALPLMAAGNLKLPFLTGFQVLDQSKDFIKTCWEQIVMSPNRLPETEASDLLDAVLTRNRSRILKVMDSGLDTADTKDLESVRQLLKYALAITMYVYGCPLHIILNLEITPAKSSNKTQDSPQSRYTLSHGGGQPPFQQRLNRQQHHSLQELELSRDAVSIGVFLASLRSPSVSLQGEVIIGLAAMMEHAQHVSNMDDFVDSIQKEIVPCLWELLSPLNDHMAETVLPLLMHFTSRRPGFFHKTITQYFNDQDWEVRFSALDSVFGLFSKLDDALVMKLYFQQSVSTTSSLGTMLNSKGKGVDKAQRQRDQQQDRQQHQSRTESSSFDPDIRESGGTGLNGEQVLGPQTQQQHQQQQQFLSYAQFLPEDLQILGPVFSFFVSSMWDREEAVRTKAKTLLKALQPVHVCHALKAWELYFIASAPEVQQTLLKLMTRLNNLFPRWKIMEYGLVFQLLTSGELGQFMTRSTENSVASGEETERSAPKVHKGNRSHGSRTRSLDSQKSAELDSRDMRVRRASSASLSLLDNPNEILSGVGDDDTAGQLPLQHRRRASISGSAIFDVPTDTTFMPAGEPSRTHRRTSSVSSAQSVTTSVGPSASMKDDAEAREKQLELEDDIHCSLLNLALQMVANGIEPRLDEVIQLKYLVVFYLDFEGCELLSLGQGKFQVRYGEYIPRQRVSPIYNGSDERLDGATNALLNDPGHENFVLAICKNLQLILDRCVEIKPDQERDPPTLYDRLRSRDTVYDAGTTPGEPQVQTQHSGRTFSATTAMSAEIAKEQARMANLQDRDEEYDRDRQHRSNNIFCFPRQKRYQDDPGDSFKQQSAPTTSHYQQHHHHHYRKNQSRRTDEHTPVVGTYFVDVILRFFGSETDLSLLPTGRLKNWLELMLIVIYKYVKEVDPLSDLVVVLMKRIVEMLTVRKGGPGGASTSAAVGAAGGSADARRTTTDAGARNASGMAVPSGEESMSEENNLLAISICSTLLQRSSTMTTALLSREIMAMCKLMTRRREDPDDPVLIRAKKFLHDAFVHFMGNGLFVLVFKTQPAQNGSSAGWEEDSQEVDQELDLFYVLATVLGEDEMIPLDPTSTTPGANNHLVHFRDQPVRDILDRVMIFRDLEPSQVSTILTNLALYVERVHNKFGDPHLFPDMGQFLIKVTKYTAEWDHQQRQKLKEQAQQMRQAHEQVHQHQLLQQQLLTKQHGKRRVQNHLFSGNTSTMVSNESSIQLQSQLPLHQQQKKGQKQKRREEVERYQEIRQHGQGLMSITSGSTVVGTTEPVAAAMISSSPSSPSLESPLRSETPGEAPGRSKRRNTVTSITLTPTAQSTPPSPSTPTLQSQQPTQQVQQSTTPSSVASEGQSPETAPVPRPSFIRQKSNLLKHMASFDVESNPFTKSRQNRQNNNSSSSSNGGSYPPSTHHHHHSSTHQSLNRHQGPAAQRQGVIQNWNYSDAILGMCATLTIQNPLEGHHLISAVKHVLRQALYRDKISAPVLIRLVTGYCYMAELDFSLSLVNVFGEFVVEELRSSIQDDGLTQRDDDEEENDEDQEHLLSPRHGRLKRIGDEGKEHGSKSIGRGGNNSGGADGDSLSVRTKILASNFHLLHHLLIWDLDPSYNMEWTQIKWSILGTMRFPPGHPILFPGANDVLRQGTASIVSDFVERYPS